MSVNKLNLPKKAASGKPGKAGKADRAADAEADADLDRKLETQLQIAAQVGKIHKMISE